MARRKSINKITEELTDSVKAIIGKEPNIGLKMQISATAKQIFMVDKLFDEISKDGFQMETTMIGSTGQNKVTVSPLLQMFNSYQANLMKQLESLGLNYNATPSKMTDRVSVEETKSDPLGKMLASIKDGQESELI